MNNLWVRLAEEGCFDVIEKLRRVELGMEGFSTIVVPAKGFSASDSLHNDVLDWLSKQNVNVINPSLEITRLDRALHGITEAIN